MTINLLNLSTALGVVLFSLPISAMDLHEERIPVQSCLKAEPIWQSDDPEIITFLVQKELDIQNALKKSPIMLSITHCHLEKTDRVIGLCIYNKITQKEAVGYISFVLKDGVPEIMLNKRGPIVRKANPNLSANLWQITIYSDFQGKGYSSAALDIFHSFLDNIGTDFTILAMNSSAEYAGSLYKKAGYEFMPNTLLAIDAWGKEQGISSDKAEEEFLKDSRQELSQVPFMVRYNKQPP